MYSTKGNALFLILIAVALFAALSYAITNSSRGSGSIDREQAILHSTQIIQYAQSISTAVQRLKIIGGCQDSQLSFNYDSDGDGSYIDVDDRFNNPTSPTDLNCHVFHPSGGGVIWRDVDTAWLNKSYEGYAGYGIWGITGGTRIYGVGSDNAAGGQELTFWAFYLDDEICDQINDKLGHPSSYFAPGPDVLSDYNGTYSSLAGNQIQPNNSELTICGREVGTPTSLPDGTGGSTSVSITGSKHFYHVILIN